MPIYLIHAGEKGAEKGAKKYVIVEITEWIGSLIPFLHYM